MIETAKRLHADLTAARAALTAANLATLEASNTNNPARARSLRARANGLRAKVGKLASEYRGAHDKAVYLHGNKAAVALASME